MNLLAHFFCRSDDPPAAPEQTAVVIHGALPAEEDTRSALEDLLDQVWRCEREWAMLDRIDLAVRVLPQGMTPEGEADAS